ncbi:AEC family transporter [Roseomonas sp. BN140053]|uniref:AEC family transporter n=1 Tax=Roseomonas sp. BN140053 TaxID=3391898 RepID=UPI0039E9057A
MSVVVNTVLPVFLVIVLGYLARRTGRISAEGVRGINDFVFALALPALLFNGAASAGPSAATATVAIAFFSGCLPVYALALLVGRWRGLRLADSGLFALDASYGNLVMLALPIVLGAYGPDGLRALLAIIGLHSIVMLPIATLVAELGLHGRSSPRRIMAATLGAVLRNPVVMGVALGGLWSLLLPPPPEAMSRLLALLGAAGPPAALFCLGASLTGFNIRRDWPDATLAVVLKLLGVPLAVWLACRFYGLDGIATAVAVTAAGMPTGANAFILARRYATGMNRSGATVLLASALSVVTLSTIIALFHR